MEVKIKKLKEYMDALKENASVLFENIFLPENLMIKNMSYNSKKIIPDSIFICKGLNFNNKYILDAYERGAALIIFGEHRKESILEYMKKENISISYIVVPKIKIALGIIAKIFYGDLSRKIKIIGITGTKGKTTAAYIIKNIFEKAGEKIAMLSSIYTFDGNKTKEAFLTTPDIFELYDFILESINNGCKYLVMEVSSQGLKLGRVNGMSFEIGVLLNIDVDHISEIEHPTISDYQKSKLLLVSQSKNFLFNLDMENADRILDDVKNIRNVLPEKMRGIKLFSIKKNADYIIENLTKEKISFKFYFENEKFSLPMPGKFNVLNALAGISVAKMFDIKNEYIQKGLEDIKVPGRMEIYKKGSKTIIIDYAHNK
ncbi:MAG: hypothetical protein LBD41_07675, partial [Clostridiales Family XIII bacterium]|nr:hypothetical protein [Clostridiales Family XIII bacterium]